MASKIQGKLGSGHGGCRRTHGQVPQAKSEVRRSSRPQEYCPPVTELMRAVCIAHDSRHPKADAFFLSRQYLLTLMNIVSLIYRDKSLGNSIQMSVVKLLILDESESFAPKTKDTLISASDMLKTFCRWQSQYSKHYLTREQPEEYDVALLLTR